MIEIKSKLENNVFGGVVLKKGINKYRDCDYARMNFDKEFRKHLIVGNVQILGLKPVEKPVKQKKEKPDYTKMSYKELVQYVKDNKIKTKSMKTADILEALQSV